ncbi:MAG: DUF4199 domain-containing protein [Cyclobacteriaceae bacterium]
MFQNPLIKIPLRYGLIAGVLGLLVNITLYYMGRHPALIFLFFDFRIIIFAIFIFIGLKEIRDYYYKGELLFWQGMAGSFVFITVFALLVSILLLIFIQIQPDYVSAYVISVKESLSKFSGADIDKVGKQAFEEELVKIKSIDGLFLATRYFIQCYGIGVFISIIISVILRKQTKPE